MRRLFTFLIAAAILPATAQTRLDLRTQSKNGAVTVENSGMAVGARAVQNFIPGEGLVNAMTDTGTRINIQQNVDTAVIQTRVATQSGATLQCASSSGSGSAYTCSMNPTLGSYTLGMVLFWRPDAGGAGGATTLEVDTLGPKAVKLADGSTNPTETDIIAGRLYLIWYDGTSFRLMIPPLSASAGERPVCGVSARGRIWQTFGAEGVKDEVAVCAKDASDVFAWRIVY